MFGMTAERASEAMSQWGQVVHDIEPSGLMLEVRDEDWSFHVQAYFEHGNQLGSIQIWRPEGENAALVTFEGMDLFGMQAREIMTRLRENGDEIDETDLFNPTAHRITLGFNREDGDERDGEDLAVYFTSVVIAPPGYLESSDT
ncbi:hypothetical protein DFJ67_5225 [Asanoa ferruginea]|uniref:Uncharacterized protein n=2 Tax=Asanoa ferruginea TaxID=53367 RepID=A0A3D9ZPA4_9ACTN|nr:hypothetical protein DFJ67_5225 [Asanoa ferruginea]